MILLGKALGMYFTKAKIELMVKMVQENINAIADIINKSESENEEKKEEIINENNIENKEEIKDEKEKEKEQLIEKKEEIKKIGINCFTHTGQSDVVETKERFKNDNTVKVLLGTTGSLGTGVDQLQFISNQIIYVNRSYRSTDEQQQIARIWRRGQPAKVVKIYYLKFITRYLFKEKIKILYF